MATAQKLKKFYSNITETRLERWLRKFVISANAFGAEPISFAINDVELFLSVVMLSSQDSAKLFAKLRPKVVKRNINCDKSQSKIYIQVWNPYLDYLIDSRN